MLRVSTTTLEAFRLWQTGDWMSESDLIAQILKKEKPKVTMLRGTAFGLLLADPSKYDVLQNDMGEWEYQVNLPKDNATFWFDQASMVDPLALIDYEHGVFEVKATKQYGDCLVVCQGDQMVGADLKEFKTTDGYFDADQRLGSYQWRFMLDIIGAASCEYLVFLLDINKDDERVASVRGVERLTVYPYVGLHGDCCALVQQFRDYVRLRGLEGELRDRQKLAGDL